MKLISYKAGIANVYFLIDNRAILLVDSGSRNQEKHILKFLSSRGFKPGDIKLIFLTHSHFDHSGSVAALKNSTGAKVILHESEAAFLHEGFTKIPGGTNRLFKFISWMGSKKWIERKVGRYPAVEPDLVFQEKLSLKPFGFDAEVIHTPGHTIGSSSVLFDDKAIVGDAMFNLRGNLYPVFADDEPATCQSWLKFSKFDVEWFYPGHGKRISKDQFIQTAQQKGIL